MRYILLLLLILTLISSCSLNENVERQPEISTQPAFADIIPQARPVATLFHAIKEGDIKLYRSILSEKVKSSIKVEKWDERFAKLQIEVYQVLGDYTLEDFSYSFDGGETNGKVKFIYKGEELEALNVVKDGNIWKIDEL